MKAKQYFTKENDFYPWSSFLEVFGDMKVQVDSTGPFQTKKLPRPMNDREILAELGPEEVDLGYVANTLKQADRDLWCLFYVKDAKGTLWAVGAGWYGGRWYVGACSVGSPYDWRAGRRVFSRRFSATSNLEPLTPRSPEPLKCPGCQRELKITIE